MTAGHRKQRVLYHLILGLFVASIIMTSPAVTYALQIRSQVTTLTNTTTSATGVTYTFGTYRVKNNESAESVQVTFPSGTDVSGATAVAPAGTISVAGQTVTIVFTTPLPGLETFDIVIGGITNPSSAGVYNVGDLVFAMRDKWGATFSEGVTTADYTIDGVTLTISVDSASLDFGTLLPGDTPPAQNVNVTVVAGMAYTMTRTTSGDVGALGLVVEGAAEGAKPPGTSVYTEGVTIAPGWDAPTDTTLTAQILYSVTP